MSARSIPTSRVTPAPNRIFDTAISKAISSGMIRPYDIPITELDAQCRGGPGCERLQFWNAGPIHRVLPKTVKHPVVRAITKMPDYQWRCRTLIEEALAGRGRFTGPWVIIE